MHAYTRSSQVLPIFLKKEMEIMRIQSKLLACDEQCAVPQIVQLGTPSIYIYLSLCIRIIMSTTYSFKMKILPLCPPCVYVSANIVSIKSTARTHMYTYETCVEFQRSRAYSRPYKTWVRTELTIEKMKKKRRM